MPQDQISAINTKLDAIASDLIAVKIDVAILKTQMDEIQGDRTIFKGKAAAFIVALTTLLSCGGAWLAAKLGFPAP